MYIIECNVTERRNRKKSILCKNTKENEAVLDTENKDKLCGVYSVVALLHNPRDNPKRFGNCTESLHEIKMDCFDLTKGLKINNIENGNQMN